MSSPTRTTTTTTKRVIVNTQNFSSYMMEQRDNASLHIDLKKSQAEEEHLKNLLIGLNEKMAVFTELKTDLAGSQQQIKASEKARVELQQEIQKLSNQVRLEDEHHRQYQKSLLAEIAEQKERVAVVRAQSDKDKAKFMADLDTRDAKHATVKSQFAADVKSLKDAHNVALGDKDKKMESDKKSHYAELTQRNEHQKTRDGQHEQELNTKSKMHSEFIKDLSLKMQKQFEEKTQEMHKLADKHRSDLSAEFSRHEKIVLDLQSKFDSDIRNRDEEQATRDRAYRQRLDDLQREMDNINSKYRRDLEEQNKHHREDRDQQEKKYSNELYLKDQQIKKQDQDYQSKLAAQFTLYQKDMTEKSNEYQKTLTLKHTAHSLTQKEWTDDKTVFKNTLHDQERKNSEFVKKMNEFHNNDIVLKNKDHETLRKEKDADYRKLMNQMAMQKKTQLMVMNEQTQIINGLTQQQMTLETKIVALNGEITKKIDVEKQLIAAQTHIIQLSEAKVKLQIELENASDYITELEEKFYKSQQTALELLRQLKECEFTIEESSHEIETLKQYIIDLKSRIAVYIPVKNDSVDKRLAEYINNYPDRNKLKIMFMRETEGVYQFGTKRVHVRVDKDRINIRVGGGFLSIDEFLDQYTPTELEKLERKDPLKRFSEKVAIQKTLQGTAVRESSPVARKSTATNSPAKSPSKASNYANATNNSTIRYGSPSKIAI